LIRAEGAIDVLQESLDANDASGAVASFASNLFGLATREAAALGH
jgi:hypothetical protein